MLDGFYVGYMSSVGYGVVLFVFRGPNIVGVDSGGVKFDGTYEYNKFDRLYKGKITVSAPPNIDIVQGINTGNDGLKYEVSFSMPENFLEANFISVSTPYGPVNIKLEKLRELGGASD